MPLSFKFNLTWITFNLIALWCLLAHEQFTILLLIHPFASKAPSLPGASPKYWAVGISCPTGWPAKPTELQCLGLFLGFFLVIFFFPFRHTHYVGSAATAEENCQYLTHIFPFAQCLPALFEMRKNPSCLTHLPHNSPISFPVRDPSLPPSHSPCPCFPPLVLLYLFYTPAISAKLTNCQSLPRLPTVFLQI